MRWIFIVLAGVLLAPQRSEAVCDVVAAAAVDFRSGEGSANRPYASPGDPVILTVRPEICDRQSSGFADLDLDGQRADDQVVTVLFVPPSGPANAVVLAESCAGIDLAACDADLGGGSAECVEVGGPGDPSALAASDGERLQFRFPDTDSRVGTGSDDLTLSGRAKIVATQRGTPLRCDLASTRCADLVGGTAATGVIACVDELYELDGTCRTDAAQVSSLFSHFVALPPPNDIEAMINDPANNDVRFTTDADGNLLAPMDYQGVLLRVDGIPVPQLARTATDIDAFSGSPGAAIQIPSDAFIASYSTGGVVLPPVFRALSDGSDPNQATFFGSVDAPRGVIRIVQQGCLGNSDDGRACAQNSECSSNVCSAELFDFEDRYASGVGPVLLSGSGGEYSAELDDPIPLESLSQKADTLAFMVAEGIDGVDRNGDGDTTDFVATLRDPETGRSETLIGTDGRAVTMQSEASFRFPALAAEGGLLAYLEFEPGQNYTDLNGNGNVADSTLRVFELGGGGAAAQIGLATTAEAGFSIDGGALSLTGDSLYFLTDESKVASQSLDIASRDDGEVIGEGTFSQSAGGRGSRTSSDGRFVVFASSDTFGIAPPSGLFVRDRVLGTIEGVAPGVPSKSEPAISADGRYIAFRSTADFLPSDTNGVADCFVYDRQTTGVERVSVDSDENQGFGECEDLTISGDGRYVLMRTIGPTLVPGFVPESDVVLRDRTAGTTERVSLDNQGVALINASGAGGALALSHDGRFALFSAYEDVAPEDSNGLGDVFIRDRQLGVTELVSVTSVGGQGNADSVDGISVSDDGRFVAFYSFATNMVPGDTNGFDDLFVRDRLAGTTQRINVGSDGAQATAAPSAALSLSADGRYVAFNTRAALVPDDTNGVEDTYLRDLRTGGTYRVSTADGGGQGTVVGNRFPEISGDGRVVFFDSPDNILVPGDPGDRNIFARAPVFTPAADLTGDLDNDDLVLRRFDTAAIPPVSADTLCPVSGNVATAGGRAVFLRDEAAGSAGPSCGDNGDLDSEDRVVHLATGATVANLRCAATEVGLSQTRAAALVSEVGEDLDLDSDGFIEPVGVLHVRDATAAAAATCAANWINSAVRGESLSLVGERAALLTPESDGGASQDLNSDGDNLDLVARLVNAATGLEVALQDSLASPVDPPAAVDFVLGSQLLAIRTREADQTGFAGNGDGDDLDDVLQVVDLSTGVITNTGLAMRPCELRECDPTRPYRVLDNTVRFLTLEVDEGPFPGCDLNDDGDCVDLLVRIYNHLTGGNDALGGVSDDADSGSEGNRADPLGGDSDDGSGDVLVSAGRCVASTGVDCSGDPGLCGASEICAPDGMGGAVCGAPGDPCTTAATCAVGSTCLPDGVVIGVVDEDQDEIPNGIDNCPTISNTNQADADADGVGDLCDLRTCGNGTIELDEECDDGNLVDLDGCSSLCVADGPIEPIAIQSSDQQKCINDMNTRAFLIAKKQNVVAFSCLRDAGNGRNDKLGTPPDDNAQACLGNDVRGLVSKQLGKLTDKEAQLCLSDPAQLPTYGYAGSTAISQAAIGSSLGIVSDLFGADLTVSVAPVASDKLGALCQREAQKRTRKLYERLWKEARKAKKTALKGSAKLALAPVDTASGLGQSIVSQLSADAKGRIAKDALKLVDRVGERCGDPEIATPLATLFPGTCAPADTAELSTCATASARCRFCEALEAADGLDLDCDDFDDANANGTCS